MPKDTRAPQEILAHIISSRVALTSAIYGLSEAELITQHPVGKWSVKDVMAHIGRWEEVCFDVLQAHLRGEKASEDYRDYLSYNDKWEAELQAYSLQEAIEHFETAHYRLFAFLAALTPEQWNGYVRTWVQNAIWHHFEEHGEQIRAWRTSRAQ
ncbi:MAG: DinB family protein [Ktedonobacteraceae bacterium]